MLLERVDQLDRAGLGPTSQRAMVITTVHSQIRSDLPLIVEFQPNSPTPTSTQHILAFRGPSTSSLKLQEH